MFSRKRPICRNQVQNSPLYNIITSPPSVSCCNAVVRDGRVPEDWSRCWMVNFFKGNLGKGDALTLAYTGRSKKLLEHAIKKDLWMNFVDLDTAFDRVPREVDWWALRYLYVDECIVSVIKAMYENASTKVRMNGRERERERESRDFNVKVGVHQGSVLSPLQIHRRAGGFV